MPDIIELKLDGDEITRIHQCTGSAIASINLHNRAIQRYVPIHRLMRSEGQHKSEEPRDAADDDAMERRVITFIQHDTKLRHPMPRLNDFPIEKGAAHGEVASEEGASTGG